MVFCKLRVVGGVNGNPEGDDAGGGEDFVRFLSCAWPMLAAVLELASDAIAAAMEAGEFVTGDVLLPPPPPAP